MLNLIIIFYTINFTLYLCMAKRGRKKVDVVNKIVNHSIGTTQNQWEQLEFMAHPESVGKLIVKKLKPKNVPLTPEQKAILQSKKPLPPDSKGS